MGYTLAIKEWWISTKKYYKLKGCCHGTFGESDTELRRFWYSFIYLFCTFWIIGMFNVIAQKRGVAQDVEGPVADLGFDALYAFTNHLYAYNPWICDQLTYSLVVILFIWILLFCGYRKNKDGILYERRIVIYKRWMIRCITVISTVLPRPWNDTQEWKYCKQEEISENYSWHLFLETCNYIAGKKKIYVMIFFLVDILLILLWLE